MTDGMSVFDANTVRRRAYCFLTKVEGLDRLSLHIISNALTVTTKRYIMVRGTGTQRQIDVSRSGCLPSAGDACVLFRTDDELFYLVNRRSWKSRLFDGLP